MDDSNNTIPLDIFLSNRQEAINYLSKYGDNDLSRNKGVTYSYHSIATANPFFIWFAAATLGSYQVGKTIGLIEQPILNNCQSTQVISNGFAWVNQEIHNNIVALHNTYKDIGISGLRQLKILDLEQQYISNAALNAFEKFSVLENQISIYAQQHNLPLSHDQVIRYVFGNTSIKEGLKDVSLKLVEHEQSIVAPMYNRGLFTDSLTVGETLSDISYIEKLVANGIKIAGANILDTYISTDNHDFNIYNDRISYFNKVFDVYFDVISQPDGFQKLHAQRSEIIAGLGIEFMPYEHHFAMNQIANILTKDFAFSYNKDFSKWQHVPDIKLPTFDFTPRGKFVLNRSDYLFLPKDTAIKSDTYFYLDDKKQLFHFRGADFTSLPFEKSINKWVVVKQVLIPKEMIYPEIKDYPNIGNYEPYTIWLNEKPVEKSHILAILNNNAPEIHHDSNVASNNLHLIVKEANPKTVQLLKPISEPISHQHYPKHSVLKTSDILLDNDCLFVNHVKVVPNPQMIQNELRSHFMLIENQEIKQVHWENTF